MCRTEISPDFFLKPKLIRYEDLETTVKYDNKFQWFYEGRNGWWQYDDRTSLELELKFKEGGKVFELLIAGFLYVIDLDNMIQYRRNDRSRKRNIKRDVTEMSGVKGVAGLKYAASQIGDRPGGDGLEQQTPAQQIAQQTTTVPVLNQNDSASTGNIDGHSSPVAPSNTPQTSQTPEDSPSSSTSSSQQDLSVTFQNLNLGDSSPVSARNYNAMFNQPELDAQTSPEEPPNLNPRNPRISESATVTSADDSGNRDILQNSQMAYIDEVDTTCTDEDPANLEYC